MDSISHVINFDMPDTADAYIHRIGRTGRAERTGDAFTLVTPDDNDMIRTLEKIMGQKLERQTIQGFDYTTAAPPRQIPAQRRPKRPATSSSREAEPRHLRRQHAQAGNKLQKRY